MQATDLEPDYWSDLALARASYVFAEPFLSLFSALPSQYAPVWSSYEELFV